MFGAANPGMPGRIRLATAWALPLVVLVVLTFGQVVDTSSIAVHANPVRFAIETAAGIEAGWLPTDSDWHPSSQVVAIGLDDQDFALGPGQSVATRIAVRNTAAVPAGLVVAVADPDPQGKQTDPASGHYLELFDQLEVDLSEAGQTLYSGKAIGLTGAEIAGELAPESSNYRLFDLRVGVPLSVDNRWQEAKTGFQIVLKGVSR
jgi:hypothetical protein